MTTKDNKKILSVCAECGITANVLTCLKKYGKPPQQLAYSVSTYHKAICDYCGEEKMVTQTRDFFHPDFSLIDKFILLSSLPDSNIVNLHENPAEMDLI